jgi:hypothetical protein
MLEAAGSLGAYHRPALVVWANEDRVMPPDHARCLTELLPQGRLVEIPDTYTLIPWTSPDGSRGSCRTSHGHRPATGQHGSRHDERSRRSALPGGVPERTPAGTVRASPMCRYGRPDRAPITSIGDPRRTVHIGASGARRSPDAAIQIDRSGARGGPTRMDVAAPLRGTRRMLRGGRDLRIWSARLGGRPMPDRCSAPASRRGQGGCSVCSRAGELCMRSTRVLRWWRGWSGAWLGLGVVAWGCQA